MTSNKLLSLLILIMLLSWVLTFATGIRLHFLLD